MGDLELSKFGISVSDLDQFKLQNGDLLHGIKKSQNQEFIFSEIYFSFINFNRVKAWKRHKEMTLNLIVPIGKVRFVFFDPVNGMMGNYAFIDLSRSNYKKLTVPPNIWFGFKGLQRGQNMLANIASLEYDPVEVETLDKNAFDYIW